MNGKTFMKLAMAVTLAAAAGVFGQANPVEAIAPPSAIFEMLALNKDLPTQKKPKWRSVTALVPSPDQTKIYICEQSAKRITVFDLGTSDYSQKILLPNEVTGCAVSKDGTKLYATCGSEIWPSGVVCEVDAASRTILRKFPVGHYPRSPVLTPDGTTLYVCNMFSNNLSKIDLASGTGSIIKVVREPYSMDITPDGTTLVVGNSLPDDRSTDTNFVSCKISIIDVATGKITGDIRLTRGSHSVFGLTISPDGKYAFATHLIGKFNMVGTTVEKGWLHTNNIAMIDIAQKKFVNDICLDLSSMGMGNPWGIECVETLDEEKQFMVIAHAGSNQLSIIHLPTMIKMVLDSTALGIDLQKNFTTLLDCRRNVPVISKGPRAVAIVGEHVYTTGFFDDQEAKMEKFKIALNTTRPVASVQIGTPRPWTAERNGESNYYDASLCFQKWQSCHSCHPLTRPDALNWILGGGTVIAPKNAKNMLFAWWNSPTNWAGKRLHAYNGIRAGIELELFRTATQELAVPLDTFFMYLKPMPSPNLVKGRLSETAQRGKAIYYDKDKVDCAVCHPAPKFTDNKAWNTTLPDPYDANNLWITPHLYEAWRTGPYGHLGMYWGMDEILSHTGHSNAYLKLSQQEMDDLVSYVLSL